MNVGEKGNIKINITGKNLIQGRMYYVNYSKGILFVQNIDREVRLPYVPERETQGIGYIIPCRAGKTYSLSVKNPNKNALVAIAEYADINMATEYANALGYSQPSPDNVSYTAKSDGIIVYGIAGKWTNDTTTIHECTESELLQVEEGAMATEYEVPAEHQSLALFAPNGLPGIKVDSGGNYTDENGQQWICDEIDLARGKYIQRVKKEKVPTDTKWTKQTQSGGFALVYSEFLYRDGVETKDKKTTWMSNLGDSFAVWENKFCFGKSNVFWIVPYQNSGEITSEGVNNWLKEHPMEIVYPLITPAERDLTPEITEAFKSLYTNYPSTVISNDENAGMEVSYIADTKLYIDKKFKELNQAIVNTQIALL